MKSQILAWTVGADGDLILHTAHHTTLFYAGSYRWGRLDAVWSHGFILIFDADKEVLCPDRILEDPAWPWDRLVGA